MVNSLVITWHTFIRTTGNKSRIKMFDTLL